jgi:hypothetical protein
VCSFLVELSQLLGFVSDMVDGLKVVGCFWDFGCDGGGTRGCYGDKVPNMMYVGCSKTVYATCLVRHLTPTRHQHRHLPLIFSLSTVPVFRHDRSNYAVALPLLVPFLL